MELARELPYRPAASPDCIKRPDRWQHPTSAQRPNYPLLSAGRPQMYVKINGEVVYLWRAVDHEGEVLESYVTKTRDKAAALTFMKKTLKRHGSPAEITTDGLRSYGAAMDALGNRDKQRIGRHLNNRIENSHLPLRRRERAMLRFRRMKPLQKFASVHANISNHFQLERHLVDRQIYKERRSALGRVAIPRELGCQLQRPSPTMWRAVRTGLTPPPASLMNLAPPPSSGQKPEIPGTFPAIP